MKIISYYVKIYCTDIKCDAGINYIKNMKMSISKSESTFRTSYSYTINLKTRHNKKKLYQESYSSSTWSSSEWVFERECKRMSNVSVNVLMRVVWVCVCHVKVYCNKCECEWGSASEGVNVSACGAIMNRRDKTIKKSICFKVSMLREWARYHGDVVTWHYGGMLVWR